MSSWISLNYFTILLPPFANLVQTDGSSRSSEERGEQQLFIMIQRSCHYERLSVRLSSLRNIVIFATISLAPSLQMLLLLLAHRVPAKEEANKGCLMVFKKRFHYEKLRERLFRFKQFVIAQLFLKRQICLFYLVC